MISVSDILKFLDNGKIKYEYYGDENLHIAGFCSLNQLKDNCIFWIKKVESYNKAISENYQDMLMIINSESQIDGINYINCQEPKRVFFSILKEFFGQSYEAKIEETSVVETNNIGENVYIGHHCYIDKNVIIGNNVRIMHNVVINCPTEVGDNTIIWSGVVIGTDGFGYYQDENGLNQKVPHYGGVKIGKNVEIGANTCIDRGTIDNTIIGDNTKVDDLSIIAHNVKIGDNNLIIGLSGLGGSVHTGKNVYIAPHSIIMNQTKIGDNAYAGLGSVIIKDVRENEHVFGNPARRIK